jgi:hypothetical protein
MLPRALKSGPDYPRTMQLPSPRLRWGSSQVYSES